MFSSIKIAMVLVLLAGAGGAFYYVKQLQHDNEVLKLNQAKLEESIGEQKEVIAMQKQSYEKIVSANAALNDKIAELNKARDELQNKLAKHDLNYLAVEKPGLIERIINKGSKDVLNEIENLTAN
jgi:uncharacterized protein YdbL (DUF1318 family)